MHSELLRRSGLSARMRCELPTGLRPLPAVGCLNRPARHLDAGVQPGSPLASEQARECCARLLKWGERNRFRTGEFGLDSLTEGIAGPASRKRVPSRSLQGESPSSPQRLQAVEVRGAHVDWPDQRGHESALGLRAEALSGRGHARNGTPCRRKRSPRPWRDRAGHRDEGRARPRCAAARDRGRIRRCWRGRSATTHCGRTAREPPARLLK